MSWMHGSRRATLGAVILKSAVALVSALALVGCSGSAASNQATRPTDTTGSPARRASTTTVATTAPTATVTSASGAVRLDPCALLTVHDASTLAGRALTLAFGGGPGSGTCAYSASGGSLTGAELTVKLDADSAAAQAAFPMWVQPVARTSPGFTVTVVPNLGDEAAATHSSFSDGIYFRQGPVLVKIGVYPPVGLAALKTAATSALGRL